MACGNFVLQVEDARILIDLYSHELRLGNVEYFYRNFIWVLLLKNRDIIYFLQQNALFVELGFDFNQFGFQREQAIMRIFEDFSSLALLFTNITRNQGILAYFMVF